MAGTPRSAKNAKVRVGATSIYAADWEVSPETNWEDTTNSESGGFEQQVACIRKCTVSMTLFFDATQNPYDSPPNFKDGQELSSVKFYLNDTTGPYWNFPLLDVIGAPMTAQVKGILMMKFNGKANGTYTEPTGSA